MYYIGCFLLSNKIKICNVHTKRVYETDVVFNVHTDYIPNSSSFVSMATLYFSSNRVSSNVRTNYFCIPLFDVRTDNTQQEKYLHIVCNLWSSWFWKIQLARKIIFIKWFEKFPLDTLTCLAISDRRGILLFSSMVLCTIKSGYTKDRKSVV